ncbi:amidohydrolase [Irregularibacter muris]|uniref:Amidohydrolase n=1 Tax=Irregularibacter muris TaxID=1796619 RepID=A0AAE3HDL6_9FIRM|nr:amidohydrolase [Irregularibacter muris]MCR1897397.1 amidohydrolase [Irregularibacter muris]
MVDIKSLEPKIIDYRRDFHKYAEGGWAEFRTSSIVAEKLVELGYEVSVGLDIAEPEVVLSKPDDEYIEEQKARAIRQGADPKWVEKMNNITGVVGVLSTGRPGPVIGLRFDMDALLIDEEQKEGHFPYDQGFASINKGFDHACGHDGHTAIGLVTAEVIASMQEELKGTIKLIFQPAEELGGGARAIVEKGILDDVDYFVATHVGMTYQGLGLPSNACACGFNDFLDSRFYNVFYAGKASHPCGDPHVGRNALLAACTAALNIHTIAPHSEGLFRSNVGILQAGTARNAIAPNAYMEVEVRGETTKISDYGEKRLLTIIEHAAKSYDVDFEVEFKANTPSGKSDPEMVKIIMEEASKLPWFENVYEEGEVGGSEDATEMMTRVQSKGGLATYIAVGADLSGTVHSSQFDFDEDCMINGVELLTAVVKKIGSK